MKGDSDYNLFVISESGVQIYKNQQYLLILCDDKMGTKQGLILFQKDIKKKVAIYEPILLGGSLFHQFAFIIYYFSTNFVSIPYHE